MAASSFAFVDRVVADRDLVVTDADKHRCRLHPRESDLAWHCDLDDGTPTDTDKDPGASVVWTCPVPRVGAGAVPAQLGVRRAGPHSDLGRLLQGLGRLVGRQPATERGSYVYTDPAGVLDDDLRRRIEHWPPAPHGDHVTRPAELWSVRTTTQRMDVTSTGWWDSTAALDHQIGLGIDLARRLAANS